MMRETRIGGILRRLSRPSRVLNYVGTRMALFFKWERVPFLPTALDVEPNNTCNFKCPHCQVTHWDKERSFLDEASFSRILDQLPRLVRVKLQGMGEPLLNKQIVSMLKMGEARGLSMNTTSNASLLRTEIAEQLATLNSTEIIFSIDGATAETFEKVRVGSKFEKVMNNIRAFAEIRGTRRQPVIAGWTVITRDNVHELADIVRLAKELGLDHITMQTFLSDWGKKEMETHTTPVKVEFDSDALARAIADAKETGAREDIDVRIASYDYYTSRNKCPWPWTGAFIAANGDVVPCCIVADSDVVKMGNVFETSFAEIWNSPAYRQLRRDIASDELPDYCRTCYRMER